MKLTDAELECSAYLPDQLPAADLPEIVFSGRSNVGKSSVINRLVNRKSLARTSSAPGKTASVNFYRCRALDPSGRPFFFRLVDLPGYGYAKVSRMEKEKWRALIDRYFSSPRDIRLMAQLVDIRHPVTPDDLQMLDYLCQRQLKTVIVATKCDKLKKTERTAREAALAQETAGFGGAGTVCFSALTGEGAEKLTRFIEAGLGR